MDTKRKIKWWKVVLLTVLAAFFLLFFITEIPITINYHGTYLEDCYYSPDFFSEHGSLYHVSLDMLVFNFSMAAFSLYGVYRCFRPAGQPHGDAAKLRRRWGWAGLVSLLVNLGILAYVLLSRDTTESTGSVANGGTWTTAGELIFHGLLLLGMILSLDGVILSLIRRKELKTREGSCAWHTVN